MGSHINIADFLTFQSIVGLSYTGLLIICSRDLLKKKSLPATRGSSSKFFHDHCQDGEEDFFSSYLACHSVPAGCGTGWGMVRWRSWQLSTFELRFFWKLLKHRYIYLDFRRHTLSMYFCSKSHCVGISAVFRVSQSSPFSKKLAKPCNLRLPANLGKQHCMSLHLAHIFKSCPQVLEAEAL